MMLEDILSAVLHSDRCTLDEGARLSRGAFVPFLSLAELLDDLEYGLITEDYLTVFRGGTRAPLRRLTTSRPVLNKRLGGFVEAAPVVALYAGGSSLQFNCIDHWKPSVQDFISHRASFPGAETLASAFIVPPRTRPMEDHTEGAHLFILQMDGRQEVLVGDPGEGAVVSATYMALDAMPTGNFALEPGDMLHVPHGWPHRTETADDASLHLAISVRYPGAQQVATALSKFLLEGIESSPAFTSHHRLSPVDKSRLAISLLTELLAEVDPSDIARRAEFQ